MTKVLLSTRDAEGFDVGPLKTAIGGSAVEEEVLLFDVTLARAGATMSTAGGLAELVVQVLPGINAALPFNKGQKVMYRRTRFAVVTAVDLGTIPPAYTLRFLDDTNGERQVVSSDLAAVPTGVSPQQAQQPGGAGTEAGMNLAFFRGEVASRPGGDTIQKMLAPVECGGRRGDYRLLPTLI